MNSKNQQVHLSVLSEKGVQLFVKREDELHPTISGNKFRKLKYNLSCAKEEGHTILLTFGGAFSNHLLATACAGSEEGFQTIGIVRGEELQARWTENPTLKKAAEFGMRFHFVSREAYRKKMEPQFLEALQEQFGDFYLLPEGGTNSLAVKGCEEILGDADAVFDHICCAVGTGGTIAGLISSARPHQKVLGYAALKGHFLNSAIRTFAQNSNWQLVSDYHFGGYGKTSEELVHFMNTFYSSTDIPLDPIYTGKMLYGIMEDVKKGLFKRGTKILVVHTGGLQGIAGMNHILKKKNLPLIRV